MIHIGETIMAKTGSTVVYTPWMARRGDNAYFAYETITEIGSPTFTVQVYHKNTEETGPNGEGSPVTISWTTTSAFKSGKAEGLKELVRYKVTVATESGTEGVVYRILGPTWYDDANTA